MSDTASVTGLNSLTTAFARAANEADKIARSNGNSTDLLQSIVGLMTAGQQVQAAANVIKIDDQTQQSLLNILA